MIELHFLKCENCIKTMLKDFPVVQRLRLYASNAGIVGSIPGQETKTPHAMQLAKKKKKKVFLNAF